MNGSQILDQICAPFGWINQVQGDSYGIYAVSNDNKYYELTKGELTDFDPWKVRSIAMFTYWYLLTQGVKLYPIEITMESIEAMRSETLEVATQQQAPAKRIVGPEAFLVDPAEIRSYVGATRIQHAPPVNYPVGYTEDGSLEIRPGGASPRRVVNDRLSWPGR